MTIAEITRELDAELVVMTHIEEPDGLSHDDRETQCVIDV